MNDREQVIVGTVDFTLNVDGTVTAYGVKCVRPVRVIVDSYVPGHPHPHDPEGEKLFLALSAAMIKASMGGLV